MRFLQLFTPESKLATPSLRLGGVAGGGGGMLTPVRTAPTAVLTRQFQLQQKVVASPVSATSSPHLKPKAAFGEMSQLGNSTSRSMSTGSIGEFTPDLCSTATVAGTFADLAESYKLDVTQSKIEMYKKVLDGLKTKSLDKSLVTAWSSHRNSLSPRPPERSRLVPRTLLTPVSPRQEELEEEEELSLLSPAGKITPREPSPVDMTTRLDLLMSSLTLNDPSGQSFLNASLGDVDLLSPNLV